MSTPSRLVDGDGNVVINHPSEFGRALLVSTIPRREFTEEDQLLVNDVEGVNMAVNATFTGTPVGIHNGIDSVLWTGVANSGIWDFNSATQANSGTFSVDATLAANNNNEAQFNAPAPVNSANYVALTGFIYITTWPASGVKEVQIHFQLNGINNGVTLDLSNFINITLFNEWQQFQIPLTSFSVSGNLNQFLVTQVDTGAGDAPAYFLDDMQIEEFGGSKNFLFQPETFQRYTITRISTTYIDASSSTLADNSAPNLSFDQLLSQPSLTNGIGIVKITNGIPGFTIPIRQLSDHAIFQSPEPFELYSDPVNSMLRVVVNRRIVLNGDIGDIFAYQVRDNLTSFTSITCTLSGESEIIGENNV